MYFRPPPLRSYVRQTKSPRLSDVNPVQVKYRPRNERCTRRDPGTDRTRAAAAARRGKTARSSERWLYCRPCAAVTRATQRGIRTHEPVAPARRM